MNSAHNPDQMAQHMRQVVKLHNKNKNTNYKLIAQQYLDITTEALTSAVKRNSADSGICIGIEELRKQLPQFTDNSGKRQYWFYWLTKEYPVYTEVRKGYHVGKPNLNKLSEVIPLALSKHISTPEQLYSDLVLQPRVLGFPERKVPVNISNLRNFCADAQARLARTSVDTHRAYHNKLQSNQILAEEIIRLALVTQEQEGLSEPSLPQFLKRSPYGRVYAQGRLALDNIPVAVREAALGACHKYDVNTSVFAFYLRLITELEPNLCLKGSHVLEYVLHKEQIRRRLTSLICHTDQPESVRAGWVKQAITALGFGAVSGHYYWCSDSQHVKASGLRDILRNSADFQAFTSDQWVKGFCAEIQSIIARICSDLSADFAEQISELRSLNDNNRITQNAFLAYLYQTYEYNLITQVIQAGHPEGVLPANNLLITLHDGFYTKKPIASISAQTKIRDLNQYAILSHAQVSGYQNTQLIQSIITAHSRHISQEQAQADKWFKLKIKQSEQA